MIEWVSNPKLIKGWLLSRVPRETAVPMHYWGRLVTGRLEAEVHLIAKLITPELVAVDVGANFGVYTYALLNAGARVVAFEPLSECADALRRYSSRQSGRLTVIEVALSDHDGKATLHLPRDRSRALTGFATLGPISALHEDRSVDLRRLDSFELGDVCLIKIDVEGHEQSVIRGAEQTIIACNLPTIVVEIEHERLEQPIAETFAYILSLGYEGWFLRDGRLTTISRFRVEQDQPVRGMRVNNFIFINPNERWRLAI